MAFSSLLLEQLFLSLILLCSSNLSAGFTTSSSHPVAYNDLRRISRCITNADTRLYAANNDRRAFFQKSIISVSTIVSVLSPVLASAKEKESVTSESVKDAFDAVRYELNSSSGVVATLQQLIEKQNNEEILQYTKESDAFFRKSKIGRARKMLTDKAAKDEALQLSNAVTFDLIGINRASRPGKENKEEALRYLGELKNDIGKFLAFEGTIVIPEN